MKVWVTKYALTRGIFTVEAKLDNGATEFHVVKNKNGASVYKEYYSKNNFFTSEKEAIVRAEEMRQKKIASMKNRIDKLEKLRFE